MSVNEQWLAAWLAEALGVNSALRLQYIGDCDPDFRRDPKTNAYCVRCQKDLKPGTPRRYVHLIGAGGGGWFLHPDDESKYVPDDGDGGFIAIGMDCVKRVGIEWTHEQPR